MEINTFAKISGGGAINLNFSFLVHNEWLWFNNTCYSANGEKFSPLNNSLNMSRIKKWRALYEVKKLFLFSKIPDFIMIGWIELK